MKARSIGLLLAALAACADGTGDLDDDGTPTPPACLQSPDVSFQVTYAAEADADVLFVVDDSSSMAEEQDRLREAFGAFAAEVAGVGRVRVAVTTTDLSDGGPTRGLVVNTFSETPPNPFIGVDRSACAPADVGTACFRGPDAAKRVLDTDLHSTAEMIAAFDANADVGTCGSGDERGLAAAVAALQAAADGTCNAGFPRPGARLVIVFVSDEEDGSRDGIDTIAERLRALHPEAETRIAVLGGVIDGEGANCRAGAGACGSNCAQEPAPGSQMSCASDDDCPGEEYCDGNACENLALRYWQGSNCLWCSFYATADCCEAIPADRYVAFARLYEARVPDAPRVDCQPAEGEAAACVVASLCEADYAPALQRIARSLVLETDESDVRRPYPLGATPENAAAVVVRVDGEVFPASQYDLVDDTIVLTGTVAVGQTVAVYCL